MNKATDQAREKTYPKVIDETKKAEIKKIFSGMKEIIPLHKNAPAATGQESHTMPAPNLIANQIDLVDKKEKERAELELNKMESEKRLAEQRRIKKLKRQADDKVRQEQRRLEDLKRLEGRKKEQADAERKNAALLMEKNMREAEKKVKAENLKKQKISEKKLQEEKKASERKNKREYRHLRALKFKYKVKITLNKARELLFKQLPGHILNISKLTLYVLFLAIVTGLFLYIIFTALIIKTGWDSNISRGIAKIFPVPAMITRHGIVEYYAYSKIKSDLSSFYEGEELSKQIKINIVERILIEKLLERIGEISQYAENFNDKTEIISGRIVFDSEINQVAINRVMKIKQMIDKGEDFTAVSEKYGDKAGHLTVDSAGSAQLQFIDDLKKLKQNEISPVVYTAEGYYIFKCVDKDDKNSYYNYVYIKAKTLDEYLTESIDDYKILSLVD
jgi:hypothetical protein